MRLHVVAVGRLKAGPERELVARYVERLNAIGRAIALGPIDVVEVDESKARRPEDRKADEARALLASAAGSFLIALDETGKNEGSDAFARRLSSLRDTGTSSIAFLIGGADGHGDAVRSASGSLLSFGAMTLPHQIVRVLVVEQIYRAATILTGHPYHRA